MCKKNSENVSIFFVIKTGTVILCFKANVCQGAFDGARPKVLETSKTLSVCQCSQLILHLKIQFSFV